MSSDNVVYCEYICKQAIQIWRKKATSANVTHLIVSLTYLFDAHLSFKVSIFLCVQILKYNFVKRLEVNIHSHQQIHRTGSWSHKPFRFTSNRRRKVPWSTEFSPVNSRDKIMLKCSRSLFECGTMLLRLRFYSRHTFAVDSFAQIRSNS